MKPRLACALLLCWLGTHVLQAAEPARVTDFDIQAQPLSPALLQFSSQGGVQVLAADDLLAGLRTRGVRGRLAIDVALRRLLAGTGLGFRHVDDDTIVLHAGLDPSRRGAATAARAGAAGNGGAVPAYDALALEEVIVTAQRRSESLQNTPLSLATLDHEQLEQRGISTLADLSSGAVPSLHISTYIGRTSLLNVAMRGIHSGDATQISRDSGVGVYIDGVYLGRSQGLGAELLDIERMEVLRGPQGTLFGRNAVGGAINIIARRPSGEFSLEQTLGVRSGDGLAITTRLELPRLGDFAVKLDGTHEQRDGTVENPLESAWDYGQYRRWGVRGQLSWQPAGDVSALYAFDRSEDQSAPYYLHIAHPPPTATLAPHFSAEPRPVRRARTAVPLEPSIGSITGHSLTADWQATSSLALRSISAWRGLDQSQFDNWAGATDTFQPGREFARASLADMHQTQFSQELQLAGELPDLAFVLGAWYFIEDAEEDAREFNSNRFHATGSGDEIIRFNGTGVATTRASTSEARSRALFGQATWTMPVLQRRLAATLGLRYSADDKHGRLTALFGETPPPQHQFRLRTSRIDPTAALEFQLTGNLQTYVRWSSAYRAGGANSRSVSFRSFGPETIGSWETGMKSEILGRRARINLALYSMRYDDLQIGFLMPGNPVNTETINTTRAAHMRGAEMDFAWIAASGLRIGGSYAWSSVHIPPQVNPFSGQEGRIAPMYVPRHAMTLELDRTLRLAEHAEVGLHTDASYWSGQYTHATDTTLSAPALVVNARVTLRNQARPRGRLSLALWGRNLFNRAYEITGISSANGPLPVFGDRRSFGVDATMHLH